MAKLYFKYGTMGSSKTAQALMTKFNYEEKGKKVLLMKPATDNRDGTSIVKSRIGLSAEAVVIEPSQSLNDILQKYKDNYDVVIVDECQFLSYDQVLDLRRVASFNNTPVLCFGLRTDSKSNLFEGSKALFELADSIAEIKSICKCGEKAIINARLLDGHVTLAGPQIAIGGNESYEGMCYKCWSSKMHNNKT